MHQKKEIQSLRERGRSSSFTDGRPRSPANEPTRTNDLHKCALEGDTKKLKRLLLHKKKVLPLLSQHDENLLTPLLLAAKRDDLKALELFLKFYEKHKLDINEQDGDGFALLHSAASVSSDQALLRILNYPGIRVDIANNAGTTPLHYFCKNFAIPCFEEVFGAFIERGARVNAQNNHGETPLHQAVFNNVIRLPLVDLLLREGAEVNRQTNRGDTALHYATNLGRLDLVALLIQNGADMNIKQRNGKTPLDVAIELKHKGIEKRLKSIQGWLREIKMEQYLPLFLKEELDKDVLSNITEVMLEGLGITNFEHRFTILQASRGQKMSFNDSIMSSLSVSSDEVCIELDGLEGIDDDRIIRHCDLEFTEKIGEGSAGKVFRGLYRGVEVAVKVMKERDAGQIEEFKKEIQVLSSIREPEIIQFLGMCTIPKLCIVTEYCSHGSLHHVMASQGLNFTWSLVIQFAMEMARGMNCLHSWDPTIVHRDVKSLNLLITTTWSLKVCDFGLSRFKVAENYESLKKLRGTPAYCAPEVVMGNQFSTKSDVYGMGIVLWELVNRRLKNRYERPYSEYDDLCDFQIMVQAAQCGRRPTIPTSCPERLAQLISGCWSHEPDRRPSCETMLKMLEDIASEYEAKAEEWDEVCEQEIVS